jgi:2-polyprenyl-3-methyl-5-hydroxy-6-metoxy-1,4-benzoquinol methylase
MSDNGNSNYEQQLSEARQIWNSEAASFDDQPDHGLRDPGILAAWTTLLRDALPEGKAKVLDIGCGTGSLSLVLAKLGCNVTGIDFSPEMIALAEAKAKSAQQAIQFHVMDAAFPQLPAQQFDVVVCRHLLWMLPEPGEVLQRWSRLLKPEGRLLLIEGFWHTGAGLHSQEILDALPALLTNISVQTLSDQADLWGGEVHDERYMIRADLRP